MIGALNEMRSVAVCYLSKRAGCTAKELRYLIYEFGSSTVSSVMTSRV